VLDGGGVRGVGPVLRRSLGAPVRSPVVLGSLAGVVLSASGWDPPGPLMEPFELIGGMAVPAMLLACGISLYGSPAPGRGPDKGPVLLAVSLKSVVQPLVAWRLVALVLDLESVTLVSLVVIAAQPTDH